MICLIYLTRADLVKLTAIDTDKNQGFCYLTIRIFEAHDPDSEQIVTHELSDPPQSEELVHLLKLAGLEAFASQLRMAGISEVQDLRDLIISATNY